MGKNNHRRGGGQKSNVAEGTRIQLLRALEQFQASKAEGKRISIELFLTQKWEMGFCLVAEKTEEGSEKIYILYALLKTSYCGV